MASELMYAEGSQEHLEEMVLPRLAEGFVVWNTDGHAGWYNACLWLCMKHDLTYAWQPPFFIFYPKEEA